jgi:hypothetical protein
MESLVTLAEQGKSSRTLVERLLGLEAQEDAIRARPAEGPAGTPDIHPNIAEIYRAKVSRLAEALNNPAERDEAADPIRGLIERVTLTPGTKPGEVNAMLRGEFGAILAWIEHRREAIDVSADRTRSC